MSSVLNARVRAVASKELAEYRRNRLVVVSMALLPALLFALALAALIPLPDGVAERNLRTAGGAALELFLLVPLIIPTVVSVHSVLGEREQGTLEPLLTTPVTDGELLRGKAIAACAPAVLLSWLLFGLFAGAGALWMRPSVLRWVFTGESVLAALAFAPLMAAFAVIATMLVSAGTRDLRVAQQLAGLAVLPMFLGAMALSFRLVPMSYLVYALCAAGVGLLDGLGWLLLRRVFDRELLLAGARPPRRSGRDRRVPPCRPRDARTGGGPR
ncbi:ABC transporter permease subunit [Actinomadura sp. ATCC 31491]|uniref:ABC transporter permease subunit n=1 Tax=Actinomadura luzonensis TaxID=2805427 RepID=A0ABT0G141_9ACTN|nr:ABC transporter permease subunit [Actinomadura luzonensis]MCK2218327.1 ABC transporter permease subunit [Actinomadura luzonensis]